VTFQIAPYLFENLARLLTERRRSRTPDLAKAKARLAKVDQEIGHLLAAIKQGLLP
jgi:hypothetical protein